VSPIDFYGDNTLTWSIFFNRKPIPIGWMHSSTIIENYCKGTSPKTIRNFTDTFRKNNAEWFDFFWGSIREVEYYHPDLVSKIISEFSGKIQAPEDWKTSKSIAKNEIKHVQEATISKFVELFRESNPEWFKMYKNKSFFASIIIQILSKR
jgi:hypothetical protein